MHQFNKCTVGKKICIITIILTEVLFIIANNGLASNVIVDQPVSITNNEQTALVKDLPEKTVNIEPPQKEQNVINQVVPEEPLTETPERQPTRKSDRFSAENKPDQVMSDKESSKDTPPKGFNKKSEPPIPEKDIPRPRGYAFVMSVIQPLEYELNERFWGWRPNDILNFTDNVNNIQLGVLEVIRRTIVVLTNRISRTGSNDTLDENLENAMNWLMIKATQYWFPSPESKYNQAIDELKHYINRLERGRARFYIRTDNLIPLLASYQDLLGGCDQSLTIKEDDDGPITSSKADNHFYYAQGVAKALGVIFKGIRKDFYVTLESVHGTQILDEAIDACEVATNIHPWLVTEGSLSSIFANHRANIDQPINRIRFYMNVLIKTLKGY